MQTDRQDKTAVGWEHNEKVSLVEWSEELTTLPQLQQHESQSAKADYQGGQLAHSNQVEQGAVGTNYVKTRPDSKFCQWNYNFLPYASSPTEKHEQLQGEV